jgi:hypothetical protein
MSRYSRFVVWWFSGSLPDLTLVILTSILFQRCWGRDYHTHVCLRTFWSYLCDTPSTPNTTSSLKSGLHISFVCLFLKCFQDVFSSPFFFHAMHSAMCQLGFASGRGLLVSTHGGLGERCHESRLGERQRGHGSYYIIHTLVYISHNTHNNLQYRIYHSVYPTNTIHTNYTTQYIPLRILRILIIRILKLVEVELVLQYWLYYCWYRLAYSSMCLPVFT